MQIGDKIRQLRKKRGWSQDELATKINANGRHLSRYENNKNLPTTEVLIKLSNIFNVSIDYLIFNNFPKTPLWFKQYDLIAKLYELIDKLKNIDDIAKNDKETLIALINKIIKKK